MMARKKMIKVFDRTYQKGLTYDYIVSEAMHPLNDFARDPDERESGKIQEADIGEFSYYTVYEKGFRIVVYIEE